MFPCDFIVDHFRKVKIADFRWLFVPNYGSPIPKYRYSLSFLPTERRYILSRSKVVPFDPVTDEDLIQSFQHSLDDDEIASCTREALKPQPDPDDIPF